MLRINPIQAVATALAMQTEPLVRGLVVMTVADLGDKPFFTIGQDPDSEYREDLAVTVMPHVGQDLAVVAVVNDQSLQAASQDLSTILQLLPNLRLGAAVLVCGELLMAHDSERPQRLGQVLSTIPEGAGQVVTELAMWAPTRAQRFAAVAPAALAASHGDAAERWVQVFSTGREPSAGLVSMLAALAVEPEGRDQLLVAIARPAFASLGESSSTDEALTALIRATERPEIGVLTRGGLAMLFAAAHCTSLEAKAELLAIGALLLWDACRIKTAFHAAEEALLYRSDCVLARQMTKLMNVVPTPAWMITA